jgi:hypothetical protein
MNRLMLLLALPFACLALLSLIAFFAVVAIAGALRSVNAIRWSVGLKTLGREDHPWDRMVGEAHPLDYVEGKHLA